MIFIMITSINEFNEYINEVRLPAGYFKVVNMFSLPNGKWDDIFNSDNIVEINTTDKYIKKWSKTQTGEWTASQYPYLELMQPELYQLFKNNTTKMAAEDTPQFINNGSDLIRQFTTTVKRFNKKADEFGLGDNTKIKVVVL